MDSKNFNRSSQPQSIYTLKNPKQHKFPRNSNISNKIPSPNLKIIFINYKSIYFTAGIQENSEFKYNPQKVYI